MFIRPWRSTAFKDGAAGKIHTICQDIFQYDKNHKIDSRNDFCNIQSVMRNQFLSLNLLHAAFNVFRYLDLRTDWALVVSTVMKS